MTQEIEQIKKALAEATPGPWKVYEQGNDERLIGTVANHPQLKAPAPVVTSSIHIEFGHQVRISENNAYLIANARIASLITTIESLQKKNEQLIAELKDFMIDTFDPTEKEYHELKYIIYRKEKSK